MLKIIVYISLLLIFVLLQAWAKISNETNDFPLKAEAALRRMTELEKEGRPHVAPDRISYNTVRS